jgi:hypothetical protein
LKEVLMKRTLKWMAIVTMVVLMVPALLMAGGGKEAKPTGPVKLSLWGGFPEMEAFYKYAA